MAQMCGTAFFEKKRPCIVVLFRQCRSLEGSVMHREKETIRSLLSALVCLLSLSCMQAEKFSLDTSGMEGLLIGGLSYEGGLFGTNPSYTVGGSITGYNGSGMVLQNNGTDSYTVPTGATDFTLPSGLADGSAFNVTVATAPGNPPQQCTVTGGTGTINAANAVGVSIACTDKAWGATTVGANMTGISPAPYLAGGIDNNGKAVAIYTSNSNQNLLWSSVGAPSTLWGAGTSISPTGSAITMLDFDISQNGTGIGIWQRGISTVSLSAYFNGSAWSGIRNVGTASHNSLQINMDAAGNGLITAIENSNSLAFKTVTVADYSADIGLSVVSGCNQLEYAAATSSSGRAAVACGAAMSQLLLFEKIGSSFSQTTSSPIMSQSKVVSINDKGDYLTAYIDYYGSNALIVTQRLNGTVTIDTQIDPGSDISSAATAIDSDGNMLVAWYRLSGSLCIRRKLAADIAWSATQCATVGSGNQGKVVLAVNDAGYGYVGLMRRPASDYRSFHIATIDTKGSIPFPTNLNARRTNTFSHSPPFVLSVNATGQGMWATTDSSNGGTSYFVFAEVLQ